jgi:hypothetical protein
LSAPSIGVLYSGRHFVLLALPLLLAGCGGSQKRPAPAIGEAWVGPATLKLRQDIPLRSEVAATVQHGERLQIIQRRRRFLRVRNAAGHEGWTEENLLLGAGEMAALRDLGERARKLPSHGVATTFDLLNVHTTPARQSPSFTQMKQGDKVDVLAQFAMPRTPVRREPLIPPAPKKATPARKRRAKAARYADLPRPTPPPPPANWMEMSRRDLPPAPPPEPPPPVPTDDWTLVRMTTGQAGWVLSRRLFMAIPDEVAQYAEGHRITSYFSLGEVQDGAEKKHHWLWTTTGSGIQDQDFDSFRVFIWNLRRHRYETAYIERKLKGRFPVELRGVTLGTAGATFPGFSICTEKEDGQRVRKDFAFIVNVVRVAGQGPCASPPVPAWPPPQPKPGAIQVAAEQPAAQPSLSLMGRVKAALAAVFASRESEKPSTP